MPRPDASREASASRDRSGGIVGRHLQLPRVVAAGDLLRNIRNIRVFMRVQGARAIRIIARAVADAHVVGSRATGGLLRMLRLGLATPRDVGGDMASSWASRRAIGDTAGLPSRRGRPRDAST